MVVRISISEKDGHEGKELLKSMNEDEEITHRRTFSSNGVKHKNVPVLNAKRPNNTEYCTREPLLRHMQSLDCRVPKHIITLDEKYLRCCLELVYASAMRGTSCSSILKNLPSQMSTLSKVTSSRDFRSDFSKFVNYHPLEAGIIGNGTIGTITGSKGGINLLKSPLFHQSVCTEDSIVGGRAYLNVATKSADDATSTSSHRSISSLPRRERKMTVFEGERFKIKTEHKRHVSVSSAYTFSGRSSFSFPSNLNRGMLHCTWKAGLPLYVFSLDDHNEIYVANIIKSESPNVDGFDYMYMFHTNEAYLVGRMRVSTSFKFCPNNLKIKETEFVLFGEDERGTGEVQISMSHSPRKSKGLSKKMSNVFKTSPISRERSSRKYTTNEELFINSSTNLLPNLELSAIVVKDHVRAVCQEPEVGGWGMKFLKKIESKNAASLEDTPPSPCDNFRSNGDCSTSMNIVIPADFHGGPRDVLGGPSSLIERWRCGGKCDCGGWDLGCPITVLNTERSQEENLSQTEIRVAGLPDSAPAMKMVNIRDGLYVVHFQSSLSALQSLSIALSIIHTQTVQ